MHDAGDNSTTLSVSGQCGIDAAIFRTMRRTTRPIPTSKWRKVIEDLAGKRMERLLI
jgi:hypothetical protein